MVCYWAHKIQNFSTPTSPYAGQISRHVASKWRAKNIEKMFKFFLRTFYYVFACCQIWLNLHIQMIVALATSKKVDPKRTLICSFIQASTIMQSWLYIIRLYTCFSIVQCLEFFFSICGLRYLIILQLLEVIQENWETKCKDISFYKKTQNLQEF